MKGRMSIFFLLLFAFAVTASSCQNQQSKVEETVELPEAAAIQEEKLVEISEPVTVEAQEPSTVEAANPAITQEPNRNKEIQQALTSAGFYFGTIDGIMGAQTKAAIENFQRSKSLEADGKVGPKTWAELGKYLVK